MKRTLLATATTSVLALGLPAGSSAAHHSECYHRSHHACSHLRQARHARVLTFGAPATAAVGAGSTASPVTGQPSTEESAGTVASFTGGVLTLTLADGSSVSGKVTEETEISCQPASHDGPGDGGHGDGESGEDGHDGGHDEAGSCSSATLLAGAVVREAELSLGGSGAVWDHIDLVQ